MATLALLVSCQKEIIEFKDARIKFEINATDDDGGVQIFLDADTWIELEIFDPNGERIFHSTVTGAIGVQGATELFMESAEPNFADLPMHELLARFPAGDYRFEGTGLDGERIVASATLTHDLPDGPILISPIEGDDLADPESTVLEWEAVLPPNGSPIIGYQVLVVQPDTGSAALPSIVLDVMMPPDATFMQVPPGFLRADTEYEWEVLAIESSGNQTLSSSAFTTGSSR